MSALTLSTPIEKVFMIGPTYANRLKKLNIFTAEDLLHHYPNRHQDLSKIIHINQIKPNEIVTIQAKIVSCLNIYTKLGKKIQKAIIQDKTGSLEAIWFNQIYIPQTLKPDLTVNFSGKVGWKRPSPPASCCNWNQPPPPTGWSTPKQTGCQGWW